MGRRPSYSSDQILDTARDLVATAGPSALGIAQVAEAMGAPSGSIYHRFASRDHLVASLWLRTVEDFQGALVSALDISDPQLAAHAMAMKVLEWSRENAKAAQLLVLHRGRDLLHGEWPDELLDRNAAQRARVDEMIGDLSERLGARTASEQRRIRFAVIDIPYGAVRSSLARGIGPPIEFNEIVSDAVVAVLAPFESHSDVS